MWETQESPPWLFSILYGVQHHFTLLSLSSFNALIKCSSSICHFQNTPLLSLHHHNRPCGQETSNPPQSCKNPPHLCLFASLHNPNPINTPSPSLSLHLLLLLLLCFLQPPTEKPRERAPSLAPFDHQTPPPTPSLHHFVRTGHSLGFWPRSSPLTNLEPATPFGLGPCFFSGGKT